MKYSMVIQLLICTSYTLPSSPSSKSQKWWTHYCM